MTRKAKQAGGRSIRDKLGQQFDAALEADFAVYGAETIIKVREADPVRYSELVNKRIMTADPAPGGIDYNSAKSKDELGLMLLKSVGVARPGKKAIARAIKANDVFVDTLEAIARDEADDEEVAEAADFQIDERRAIRKSVGF